MATWVDYLRSIGPDLSTKTVKLQAFKSGARCRGLRFSKRHPKRELRGMVEDTIPTIEIGKEDPRPGYPSIPGIQVGLE